MSETRRSRYRWRGGRAASGSAAAWRTWPDVPGTRYVELTRVCMRAIYGSARMNGARSWIRQHSRRQEISDGTQQRGHGRGGRNEIAGRYGQSDRGDRTRDKRQYAASPRRSN